MKELVKQKLLSLGADVCGIANIDRFDQAPAGFSPIDLYPKCRSVITFGVALPKGLAQVEPRLIYGHFNALSCQETDRIGFTSAKQLEQEFHCTAVPLPCDSPYEYWRQEELEGRGLISMKHAAVLSGLGTLGKSSLLLNPQYGSLLTIGAILTDLDLPSDQLCESICLPGCQLCVTQCPAGAIHDGRVNQQLCRTHTYGSTSRGFGTVDCNICRTVCPMKLGRP